MVVTCHLTLVPSVAVAVKLAVVPAQNVPLVGFVVTLGAVLTVSVAAFVVLMPHPLVNTARYCFPLSTIAGVKL